MINVASLALALEQPNRKQIEVLSNGTCNVYFIGDALPSHMLDTVPTQQQITDLRRFSAKKLLDASTDEDLRFRALLLVVLDEINLIRSKLSPALAARTSAQLKTAMQTKIDAGDAD